MVQLRQPLTSTTSATDTVAVLCTVQQVDTTRLIADVLDQTGTHRKVSLKVLPGKPTAYPAVGERWVISREYGDWAFIASVNVVPTGGAQGPQGVQGATGPQGPQGVQGPQGTTGGLADGGVKTAAFTSVANTYYVITLAGSLGAVAVNLPTTPANGTRVAFIRTDATAASSFCNITPGGADTIAGGSPWVLSMTNGSATFLYESGVWYVLTVGFREMTGLLGPSSVNGLGTNLMSRNSFGQSEVGTPTTASHAVNKNYVDATAGTSASTASTLVRRDASSRAQFADPSAAQDAATKNYVDSGPRGYMFESTSATALTFATASGSNSADQVAISYTFTLASQRRVKVMGEGRYILGGATAGRMVLNTAYNSGSTADPATATFGDGFGTIFNDTTITGANGSTSTMCQNTALLAAGTWTVWVGARRQNNGNTTDTGSGWYIYVEDVGSV